MFREIAGALSPILVVHSFVQVALGLALNQPREALIGIVALPAIIALAFVVSYPLTLIRIR